MKTVHVGDVDLGVLDVGRGAVLLLVHGFPLDHTMWQGQIRELSQSHRVIAPDLRGFGSSGVTAGTVTMAQMADDLASVLDALGVHDPVNLVGLSMGGYVAWQFWERHPERLARMVLCDTRACADTVEVARGRLLMARNVEANGTAGVADVMVPKLFAPATHRDHPELIQSTRHVIDNTSPIGIAAAQRGMSDRPDVADRLGDIRVPVLVVCGEHDSISSPQEMREISAAIPGAQFVEVPAAGHMAPLERPDIVNAAVASFMDLGSVETAEPVKSQSPNDKSQTNSNQE